jgi:hypothetical protein
MPKCQNTTIPVAFPSWPEESIAIEEHCQGMTEGKAKHTLDKRTRERTISCKRGER